MKYPKNQLNCPLDEAYLHVAFDGSPHYLSHVSIVLESFVNWNALNKLRKYTHKKVQIRKLPTENMEISEKYISDLIVSSKLT